MLAFAFLLITAPLDQPALQKARQAYQKAHFEEVAQTLRDRDLSALDAPVRGEALFMLGVAELALQHDSPSQKAFVRLFTEQPDFALPPYTAPKVVAACERAKKQVVVVLRPKVAGGKVVVCGDGLPARAGVRVVFNPGTAESVTAAKFTGDCFEAPLSAGATTYLVQASIDGEPRGEAGSRQRPLSVGGKHAAAPLVAAPLAAAPLAAAPLATPTGAAPLPATAAPAPLAMTTLPAPLASAPVLNKPWYKKWWPWTILGAVVAGGTTAAILAVALNHPTGTIRVTIASP